MYVPPKAKEGCNIGDFIEADTGEIGLVVNYWLNYPTPHWITGPPRWPVNDYHRVDDEDKIRLLRLAYAELLEQSDRAF